MKTQFLSTLTQQKAWTLFFLTLLHLKQSHAGQAFKNCLQSRLNDTTSYNILLNFPFNTSTLIINNNNSLLIHCDKSKCEEGPRPNAKFQCRKILDNISCFDLAGECIGVIGNSLITENKSVYGATCPIWKEQRDNFSFVKKLVNDGPIDGLNLGYGLYNCSLSNYCLRGFCVWDNGGWMCHSILGFQSESGYCYMQWPAPWPGSAENNPMPIQATTESSIPTPTNPPVIDEHLTEKIAIPIGTITGTSIISGITYYYCKKRRREELNDDDQETNNNEEIELAENSPQSYSSDLEEINNLQLRAPHSDDYISFIEEVHSPQWVGRSPQYRG